MQQMNQASERQTLETKYNRSRMNLLWVVVFTAINIVLLVTDSGRYFLFSAYIPYLVVDLAMLLCGKYPAEFYAEYYPDMEFWGSTFFAVMMAIAAVLIVLYLVSWLCTKKPKMGWMIFALIFFAIDTAAMLYLTGITADMILDVVFHGWVIVSLIMGIIACAKLKKLPEEPEVPAVAVPEQTTDNA